MIINMPNIGKPMTLIQDTFMSLKLNQVDPEKLRKHLINNYSIGIIALNSTDIRIAFSCVEKKIFLMSLNLLLMQLMILNKFKGLGL